MRHCGKCGGQFNPNRDKLRTGLCYTCRLKGKGTPDHALFKAKASAWEPVEITVDAGYKRWSESALHCLYTGKDCATCDIRLVDRSWGNGCHIPEAVQQLLNRQEYPPDNLLRRMEEPPC